MLTEVERWSPAAIRILSATAELVTLRGYSATSTRDIAAAELEGLGRDRLIKVDRERGDLVERLLATDRGGVASSTPRSWSTSSW
jgi:hypothetical protein